ncbi:MAG: acetyl-CoA hydrolase/transferase family protein [Acidobacteriota bacterium]
MNWKEDYKRKLTTAEHVAKLIKSGDIIGVGGGTCIPPAIADAIGKRAAELENVTFCQGFAVALHEYMKPEHKNSFRIETIFIGPAERFCIQNGMVDFVPNHLGQMERWVNDCGAHTAAFVVTPPDENGYMNKSLFGGLIPSAALRKMKPKAVEINSNTPWLNSKDFQIHVSEVDYIVENTSPVFEVPEIPITKIEEEIGGTIADMISNGSTIQLGLGGLANCVGHFLRDHKDLGVHSEVCSNSIMDLVKCGAVNNSKKSVLPGKVAYTFAVGTKELYNYLDRNEDFVAFEIGTINDPNVIAQNDNIVSVNNALMIDLTGQVASESIGTTQFSATGGQVAFVKGAQMAKNGKSILALPSTRVDSKGQTHSRIMDILPAGTIITTLRTDVEWIVTEFGAVRLTNKPVSWRAKELIKLAHPDFRDELTFKAKQIGWI